MGWNAGRVLEGDYAAVVGSMTNFGMATLHLVIDDRDGGAPVGPLSRSGRSASCPIVRRFCAPRRGAHNQRPRKHGSTPMDALSQTLRVVIFHLITEGECYVELGNEPALRHLVRKPNVA